MVAARPTAAHPAVEEGTSAFLPLNDSYTAVYQGYEQDKSMVES